MTADHTPINADDYLPGQRHQIPYRDVVKLTENLAALQGFICMGPAPGDAAVCGTSWISALPVWQTIPELSLQENLEQLRNRRQLLLATRNTAALPAVVGVLHYEAAYSLSAKLAPLAGKRFHGQEPGSSSQCPLQAGVYDWCLAIDHDKGLAHLNFHQQCAPATRQAVCLALKADLPPAQQAHIGPFLPLQPAAEYQASVERIRAYIRAGDCYQANLSQQFQASFEGSGWVAYKALSALFPTAQSAFLAQGGSDVLSLSPEIFVNVRGRIVETRPIKGTRRRGNSAEEDQALAEELLKSEKDRAENLMIVDLLRNDLGRLCETGSVTVQDLFKLESYANVHHLVSTVKGELLESVDALDLLLGCFPGGSITGAPKLRAMEVIAELEPHRRGPYCGSVFRWDSQGDLVSNIAIRTLWRQGQQIRCCGGGGIVNDSDPAAEYAETLTKVRLLMTTLEELGSL